MDFFPSALENLIDKFASLPGIGRKTAQRLAFFVLAQPDNEAFAFAEAIADAKRSVCCCTICQNLTDSELCAICRNPRRDTSVVCVVTDPKGVLAIERSHEFGGRYHVLHGVISPMNNVGPDDVRIKELVARLGENSVKEVILATNPNIEGESTASYISRLIRPMGVKTTRIAHGVPVGGDLEYADEVTLAKALEGRREI